MTLLWREWALVTYNGEDELHLWKSKLNNKKKCIVTNAWYVRAPVLVRLWSVLQFPRSLPNNFSIWSHKNVEKPQNIYMVWNMILFTDLWNQWSIVIALGLVAMRRDSLIAASSKVRFDLICAELRVIMYRMERERERITWRGSLIKDWPDFTVEIMPLSIYVHESSKPVSISFFLWASLKNWRFFSTIV